MRPTVAVTATRSDAAWVAERVQPYLNAVAAAGGDYLLLAPDNSGDVDFSLEDSAHGLLLSGGGDIHPRRYGQPLAGSEPDSIDEPRDDLELTLARAALAADLPILAICRGVQVLNVALGGGLVQHVDGHRDQRPNRTLRHDVRVTPGSRLARLLGCDGAIQTNSSHHQAIDDSCLAPGLRATALSLPAARQAGLPDDHVIEGVESPAHRWVVGVQWHPERVTEVPAVHQRLFSDFIAAAREEAERRRARCGERAARVSIAAS